MRVNHSSLELGSEDKKNRRIFTVLLLFQEFETEGGQWVTKQEFGSLRNHFFAQLIRP